ncbi:TIGR00269 family protein [Candidatus Woesearchaeota archaeon]|nr:TIGR00269 family protein [Candidatus Woesearchaeota archaeon]
MNQCCIKKPVFTLTGKEKLCKSHFLAYFEKKVRKTIRIHKLIDKKENILVAVSGGKDSTVVLYLLHKIINNKKINIEALHIDQSIGNYSRENKKNIRNFCKKYKIKLHETSFRKEFGYSLCYMKSTLKSKGINLKSCSICGILRRYIVNKTAKKLKSTKVVTGHNLDDEAQSVVMNIFKNNIPLLSRLGPKTGLVEDKKFIPRIKPLYFCTEEEVILYCKLMNFDINLEPCPCSLEAYRRSVLNMLDDFENKNTGTKYGIIQSFLEIKPFLKYRGTINACKKCGEAAAKDICSSCKLIENLKK